MYIFILGKNKNLSKLEISRHLAANYSTYKIIENADNYLTVDIKDFNPESTINELAGTLKIGEIDMKTNSIDEVLDRVFLNTKFNYSITNLNLTSTELEIVELNVKKYLKKNKFKANYKKPLKNIVSPSKYSSWELDNGFELIAYKTKGDLNVLITLVSANTNYYKDFDNSRPARKFTHGTSFRLTNLMLNLFKFNHKTLVDPYCGTGTFSNRKSYKGFLCNRY
ncbi:MAG: hypothetical protein Q9M91_03240 [Candidatus Dojkabacteria bacterium]|nr:hypothetical protein [Candidatus Dojkabacteria bacterium]